jgi:alpha-glucosidase
MQWTEVDGAGFTNPGVDAWLPFSDDFEMRNVEAHLERPTSLLNLYRGLLALRRREPALQAGDYQGLGGDGVFSFLRCDGRSRLLVALNFTEDARVVKTTANLATGWILISTKLDREGPQMTGELEVRPHEGVIVKLG